MNTLGVLGYGAAGLAYLLLTTLLSVSWKGRGPGILLIAASAISACWAIVLSVHHHWGTIPAIVVYELEISRGAVWVLAISAVAAQSIGPRFKLAVRVLACVLLAAPLIAFLLERKGIFFVDPTILLSRTQLALSLLGLVLVEQLFRNASHSSRNALKYFCIGVGAMFAYDLFLYSQVELIHGISSDAWNARGVLSAVAVPLLAISARRNPQWSLDIFVSRQAVFYTTTFMVVGAYLTVMALGGFYVRERGGEWGVVGQIVFMAGAIVALVGVLASETLRRYARVFLSKHFYRNKYDYRIEWLRFIGTLSSTDEEDVRRTAVRAIAQIFSSPGGFLFLRDEEDRKYHVAAAWPMHIDSLTGVEALSVQADLAQFLARTKWIIDMDELRSKPDVYRNIEVPGWLLNNQELRIVSPLLQLDELLGFIVLYNPPPPFQLTYEDRDLLKTVGRHVATHIAQHDAHRRLAESRQFEAYNKLTAFMMHDLKNSVAQLKLIVVNSRRHKHNPEFIDDAIETIDNTVERMTKLIEQLKSKQAQERQSEMDLAKVVHDAVARCADRKPVPVAAPMAAVRVSADPERLISALEHVIRNAQDATAETGAVNVGMDARREGVTISVSDSGAGMTPEFIRDRLFRPFDSTKGSKGMGIGAYQVREYIRQIGGTVEVSSSPGQGTRFLINLPVSTRGDALSVPYTAAGGAKQTEGSPT
ncbi:MAG TPA: XrtA/PEP-CTERM system histidine kinase PrsK [Steroidobacteraceae bacterium]|nr:XrtA/PEP-CTERM system histidine kinase PrsK [Steroidobacteraceae bacterium]